MSVNGDMETPEIVEESMHSPQKPAFKVSNIESVVPNT